MRTSAEHPGPVRTCIGCRRRRPQASVLRCGVRCGVPVVGRTEWGRGAWVCGRACAETALRNGGFERAWRTGVRRADLEAMVSTLPEVSPGHSSVAQGVSPVEVCETGFSREG